MPTTPSPEDRPEVWSLPELLDRLPPPDQPITGPRPYLREGSPGEYVIRGIDYLPVVDHLWQSFFAAGFPRDSGLDYITWLDRWMAAHPPADPQRDAPEAADVAAMSRLDCFTFLTFIRRRERLCDGWWIAAHEQGWFHAIARRLIDLDRDDTA